MIAQPHRQNTLARDPSIRDIKEPEKRHVSGLVGKCLRQETFRNDVAVSIPLLSHEGNTPSVDTSLLTREQSLSTDPLPPRLMKSVTGRQELIELSDSEDEAPAKTVAPTASTEPSPRERELQVARKAMRKWWRLAGLNKRKGHEMGFEKGEELDVSWTRGILPRVEGRIKIVGQGIKDF